jgi:phosphatidate cytidylyltransferase
VSKSANVAVEQGPSPGLRNIKFNKDWVTRPLFGLVLAALTVSAVVGGTEYFALLCAAVGVAAAREWSRLVTSRAYGVNFFITSATIVATELGGLLWPHSAVAWILIAIGAALAAGAAAFRGKVIAWQATGTLYLCVPILALLSLRISPHGAMIIVALFVGIWMSDTGALIVGKLVGGPRLWPSLSPNKTWAGTIGGVVAASLAEVAFVTLIGGTVLAGVVLGVGIGVTAHCGDLFESWVKRVFHRKDSGSMIPGHGGVLDRIDSTLAAAPCLAALVLIGGVNPLFGVQV